MLIPSDDKLGVSILSASQVAVAVMPINRSAISNGQTICRHSMSVAFERSMNCFRKLIRYRAVSFSMIRSASLAMRFKSVLKLCN